MPRPVTSEQREDHRGQHHRHRAVLAIALAAHFLDRTQAAHDAAAVDLAELAFGFLHDLVAAAGFGADQVAGAAGIELAMVVLRHQHGLLDLVPAHPRRLQALDHADHRHRPVLAGQAAVQGLADRAAGEQLVGQRLGDDHRVQRALVVLGARADVAGVEVAAGDELDAQRVGAVLVDHVDRRAFALALVRRHAVGLVGHALAPAALRQRHGVDGGRIDHAGDRAQRIQVLAQAAGQVVVRREAQAGRR